MVLREGNGSYFWGCERFPECWGKKLLRKDEIDILPEFYSQKLPSKKHAQPILADSESVPNIAVKRIAEKSRVYVDEPFVDIFHDLKSRYPDHLIIIENGYYFEVFEQDAYFLSEEYGWKIIEQQIGVPKAGFPTNSRKVWDDLKQMQQPYIIVSQLPNPSGDKIQRTVGEIFP